MKKLGKICRLCWKERLQIRKIAKFESFNVASLYRPLFGDCGGGTDLSLTIQSSVNFLNVVEPVIILHAHLRITFKLGKFTYYLVSTDFP